MGISIYFDKVHKIHMKAYDSQNANNPRFINKELERLCGMCGAVPAAEDYTGTDEQKAILNNIVKKMIYINTLVRQWKVNQRLKEIFGD